MSTGGWSGIAGLLVCGGLLCPSLVAQTSTPTGTNPISTKPEGQGQNCSYSGSIGSGGATTNSSTCPPAGPGTSASPGQRFPFPGETTPTTPQPAATQPATQSPAAPSTPAAAAGQRFPFPGEAAPDVNTVQDGPPLTPEDKPGTPALRDEGSSGQSGASQSGSTQSGSSSSSSNSSSSNGGFSSSNAGPDLPDDNPNAPMPTPREHRSLRRKLPAVSPMTTDDQEAEDVQVAGFYQNDGNYKAAYERAKHAVSLVDDDAEAYLALGEAARKLGKLDEAETSFKKALALDPVPKTKKAAERALKEMSGS